MFRHFLKLILTRLFRQSLYSLISITSLAIGLAAGILILAFIRYESSFDSMHLRSEDIYRLNWRDIESGSTFATFFNPVTPVLDEALAEIEAHARLAQRQHLFTVDSVSQPGVLSLVDTAFFDFFSYPALAGEPAEAIAEADGAVLTEAAAVRLFGRSDVLGEVFTVDGMHDFRVGAVVSNNPANSHLGANVFVNIENLPALWNAPGFWSNFGSDLMYHYVRLAPGTDAAEVPALAHAFLESVSFPMQGWQLLLQPLRDIHFTTDLQNEMPVTDDMLGTAKSLRQQTDILIFSAVGLLSVLVAMLNFMNMRTVQFARQAREVAVRRVAGASRGALTVQLLAETVLMAMLALLFALPLCELLLPYLGAMLGAPLAEGSSATWDMLAPLTLGAVLLGLVAGFYPSWTAARLSPVAALRGEMLKGRHAVRLRAMLIVLQFTISIGLMIGAFTVSRQIDYAFSRSPGFEPAAVVRVELPNAEARNAFTAMREQLLTQAAIRAVSAGTTIPTGSLSDGFVAAPVDGNPEDLLVTRVVSVSEDYFDVLGMSFVAGRPLSEDFGTDRKPPLSAERPSARGGIVLNETAARLAGWTNPQDAIGREYFQMPVRGQTWRNDYTVVGVVADAHYGSIRREVEPLVYLMPESYSPNVMIVQLAGSDTSAALAAIDAVWQDTVSGYPLQLRFLEDEFTALYEGERRTFGLFIALAALAVLIACSGLYGLAAWLTERRTKEIGVRKVLGSGVWRIVLLFTGDFSRPVLLSNLIAWPLAWFAMSRWLENFAYRIDLTPMIFVGSGAIALCIAWVTVGGTAAKAASAKPVLALRYE